jgi:hypothetical protein
VVVCDVASVLVQKKDPLPSPPTSSGLVVVWALCIHSFVVARFRARQGGCHWRGRGRRRWRVTPVGIAGVVPVGVAPAGIVPVGGAVMWHWPWLETQPVATL